MVEINEVKIRLNIAGKGPATPLSQQDFHV